MTTTIPVDIHIVIYPDIPSRTPEELISKFELIAEKVQKFLEQKHIPAVVFVDCEEQPICEYCGSPVSVETEEEDGYPLCCEKAQEEWEKKYGGENN